MDALPGKPRFAASSLARLTRRAPLSRTASISGAWSRICLSACTAGGRQHGCPLWRQIRLIWANRLRRPGPAVWDPEAAGKESPDGVAAGRWPRRVREEATVEEHFVWMTTRQLKPGTLAEFERACHLPARRRESRPAPSAARDPRRRRRTRRRRTHPQGCCRYWYQGRESCVPVPGMQDRRSLWPSGSSRPRDLLFKEAFAA